MRFLHQQLEIGPEQAVEVIFDQPEVNVVLLRHEGFIDYQSGRHYRYVGGRQHTAGAILLKPPTPGRWHLVVDRREEDQAVTATQLVVHAPNHTSEKWKSTNNAAAGTKLPAIQLLPKRIREANHRLLKDIWGDLYQPEKQMQENQQRDIDDYVAAIDDPIQKVMAVELFAYITEAFPDAKAGAACRLACDLAVGNVPSFDGLGEPTLPFRVRRLSESLDESHRPWVRASLDMLPLWYGEHAWVPPWELVRDSMKGRIKDADADWRRRSKEAIEEFNRTNGCP